jgi:RNA polymerase sigma-70 factor (ECF subfamily)
MEADERLMERVLHGDAHALEALIERYRGRLHGFLCRRSDLSRVDDLFQETWLRVVRGRASFDPARRFSTWLFGIANNLCRDLARRHAVATRDGHTAALALLGGKSEPPLDLRLDVRQRLHALPDRLREVIVLRYFDGMAEREIAEIVGVPQGTVKSRLHAAVRCLRGQEDPGDVVAEL